MSPVVFAADLIPGRAWLHIPITMGYDRYPEQLVDERTGLLTRLLDFFGPMRERREELAAHLDDVEDILEDGARRARMLGEPVLAAAREATGLGRAL